ncbi:hypothetical protein K502DRAFT_365687 [Neoconidiobolus thromboides FSU 785]|nr:hypothetical protein K502DRAFT_365687 [Neoconidiobolus thromboides FSU 785]
MSDNNVCTEPPNMVRNMPLNNNRRLHSRAYPQPPVNLRRPRGVSSPQPLNRNTLSPTSLSMSTSSTTDSINLTLSPRVNNGLRPNLSPQRPNLSPLISPASTTQGGPIQLPTPINMVDRLTSLPNNNQRNLSPMQRFLNLARKLSPRSNQNSQQLQSIGNRLQQVERLGSERHSFNGYRRYSPSYENNRPQPLFPNNIKDAGDIMNKLLASNPPANNPSPAMRRIRNLTPKLLLKSPPKNQNNKVNGVKKAGVIGSSPLSQPPLMINNNNNNNESPIDKLPLELLNLIFSKLYSPKDLINCSLVCKRWQAPAKDALDTLLKNKPYADLPMLRTLRKGLNEKQNKSIPQIVNELSIEYCQSNPKIYQQFLPDNSPETMISHLFWIFLFLDREFRNGNNRRLSCDYFIKLVHNGISNTIDKSTLKSLYQDIKANPLIIETEDNSTIYISNGGGMQQFLPHPIRKWWRRITHRNLNIEVAELDALSDVEEEDPFRPLE